MLVRRRPGEGCLASGAAALAGVRAAVASWRAAEEAARAVDEATATDSSAASTSAHALLQTPTGVEGVIGAEDLPAWGGVNNCDGVGAEAEPIFAVPGARTMYWGQPAAVVIADTEAHAHAAALALSSFISFVSDEEEEKKQAADGATAEATAIPVSLAEARQLGESGWLPSLSWMPHAFHRGDAAAALAAAAAGEMLTKAPAPASSAAAAAGADESKEGGDDDDTSATTSPRVVPPAGVTVGVSEGTIDVGGQSHFYMECQSA